MSDTQWVVSKYAPEMGEKFEVLEEMNNCFKVACNDNSWYHFLPKREYIPTTPPERWEPINAKWHITGKRAEYRDVELLYCYAVAEITLLEGFRFIEGNGALLLQRKVTP